MQKNFEKILQLCNGVKNNGNKQAVPDGSGQLFKLKKARFTEKKKKHFAEIFFSYAFQRGGGEGRERERVGRQGERISNQVLQKCQQIRGGGGGGIKAITQRL